MQENGGRRGTGFHYLFNQRTPLYGRWREIKLSLTNTESTAVWHDAPRARDVTTDLVSVLHCHIYNVHYITYRT